MRRWSAIVIAGCIAFSGLLPLAALAEAIQVAGNQRIEADTIRSYFRAGGREPLDAADLDKALKELYATGQFADVRITRRDGAITVSVTENPAIARIAFEGNAKVKDADLSRAVESKAGGPLDRPRLQGDV